MEALSVPRAYPDNHPLALMGQAADMDRSQAMKKVVGPALTALMRPVYEQPLGGQEAAWLPAVHRFGQLFQFDAALKSVLYERIGETGVRHSDRDRFNQLDNLIEARRDLFYYNRASRVLVEGVESSVTTPINIASHIYRIEEDIDSYKLKSQSMDHDKMTGIMERQSFDAILLQLTKGPNDFLGDQSASLYLDTDFFFGFKTGDEQPIELREAYRTEAGRVAGLSDLYTIAANVRRKEIKARQENKASKSSSSDHGNAEHQAAVSSGCPVRHRFEDETGEPGESLIITAKKFVVDALRVSQRACSLNNQAKTDTI